MALKLLDTAERFGPVTQLIHWVTVLLVLALFGIGWYMTDLPLEPETFEIYAFHKSLGLTVLGLTLLRLVWRLANTTPPVLGDPPRWQRLALRVTHGGIYTLLIVIPMSGWLLSSAADFLPSFFGLFELPALVEPDDALREQSKTLHQVLGWLLALLLAVHIAAALKHHFSDRDATLRRMLPGAGP